MDERCLVFKEFLPAKKMMANLADRVWIHPNGRLVVLIDGVSGCSNPARAAERCLDWLTAREPWCVAHSPAEILLALHEMLSELADDMVVAACLRYDGQAATCAWVGNPRLYLFNEGRGDFLLGEPLSQPMQVLGMAGPVSPQTKTFSIPPGAITLLTSDGLDHRALMGKSREIQTAHSNLDWQRIAEATAVDEDWSMVVFPIEQSFDFVDSRWPYNPFVGPQEDRDHEKRGLARIAAALFAEDDFAGFRIVGGSRFTRANSSRLLDGLLVSPWGVVGLELKDQNGKVVLPLGGQRQPMKVYDENGYREDANPVAKVSEALRSFSEFNLGCDLDHNHRKTGAVVFTHPDIEVVCLGPDGGELIPPLKSGEVIVATPTSLAGELRRYVRSFSRKKCKAPISASQIETICRTLVGVAPPARVEIGSSRILGRFQIPDQPDPDESTSYYQVFVGKFQQRDKKVWVKKFDRVHLARGQQSQVEESRLREVEALQVLPAGCAQKYYAHFLEPDGLYVVLEHVDGPRLDQWLAGEPSRRQRLEMLRQIAGILVLLAEEQIVHRGLTPHCVRIRESDNTPVLVNFELCQMDVVATLPLSGRRLLDIQYVAKEVNVPGTKIDCAADVYSFGKMVCLTLSGELPFPTFVDQSMAVKKRGFWERIGRNCGLTATQGLELARMMSPSPDRRPSAQEVLSMLEGWQ